MEASPAATRGRFAQREFSQDQSTCIVLRVLSEQRKDPSPTGVMCARHVEVRYGAYAEANDRRRLGWGRRTCITGPAPGQVHPSPHVTPMQ